MLASVPGHTEVIGRFAIVSSPGAEQTLLEAPKLAKQCVPLDVQSDGASKPRLP